MSFFKELKRRNVFRAGATYIFVSWLIIQVIETIFPAFGYDDSVIRIAVIILAIGFLPVVVLAWVFELTPEGLKHESEVDYTSSGFQRFDKRLDRIVMIVLVLIISLLALDRFVWDPGVEDLSRQAGPDGTQAQGSLDAVADNSIAVLPFVSMSTNPEHEFFADGMTEELLNILARVPDLRVTARTSSFFFKGKNMPVTQIAETLNVKHILEGSVRRSGQNVRITAQLIEAGTDRHLWSETYDRNLEDIFAVQDEVATAIVESLTGNIEGLNENPVSRSRSLAAYEAYRTGRLRWWRRSVDELHQAIGLFEQAIESDPGFAPAYAAIADSWMLLVTYGDMHIMEGSELAEKMIDKALELDPECAEAYAARGLSRLVVGRKVEAETALRRAISIDGAYIPAYLWMSIVLSNLGRVPEAGANLLAAIEMDPLNEMLAVNYANNLQTRGDYEGATSTIESLLRLQPEHAGLLTALSGIHLNSGQLVEAWKTAEQAYSLEPGNVSIINSMANTWMGLGEYDKAEATWISGIEKNRKSVELKIQYLTMLLIAQRVDEAQAMMGRIFPEDVTVLPEGFQRTYHYFMGLITALRQDYPQMREHFERVIDPAEDQLYDRNQVFVITTAALLNMAMGDVEKAEEQLLTAERVVGHARINGIENSEIYYSFTSLFAMRGETGKALQTLQQAYDKGFRLGWLLEADGRMDTIRGEPAFLAIQAHIADDIERSRAEVRGLATTSNW